MNLDQIKTWLEGKKTYITVGVIFLVGGLQAIGVTVPEWVYAMLGAMGLGFLRAGVKKDGRAL